MNSRERLIAWVLGQPVDRPPFWLFWGPWESTWERWKLEGKPAEISDVSDLADYFNADLLPIVIPVNCGPCPKPENTIIEEDDDYVIFRDSWGIIKRDLKHSVSMPQFLEFPVKNREDWEIFKVKYLDPHHPDRLAGDWQEQCAVWTSQGRALQLGYYPDVGLFGSFRWLLGDEEGLVAFHTMPDLVHEIMDHMTTLYLTVFEQVVGKVQVDVIHIWEDMCYRNGPLISPKHWRQFMGPHYHRIKAFAEQHNIPILSVDTDGNPEKIATPMIETGVNLLLPMEVAAGCDVNQWRDQFPTLALSGGFDKRTLALGPEAIDNEFARIFPALKKGRYIPTLDHLVPDDVSWENYVYYVNALKAMIDQYHQN